MSESEMLVTLGLTCFAAALLGAIAGAALVWRVLVQRAERGVKPEIALQEMQHRLPALLQQTLKVEFDFYAQRQIERDGAQSLSLARWQAEQEQLAARREKSGVIGLRGVLDKLEVLGALVASAPRPDPARQMPVAVPLLTSTVSRPLVTQPTDTSAHTAHPISARPPELLHTPLPRTAPVHSPPETPRELTDEEIDALPADLPEASMPRKRILPSPKKPTLRSL